MGMMLVSTGLGLLLAAVVLSIVTAATAPGAKRKIQERMKEKY